MPSAKIRFPFLSDLSLSLLFKLLCEKMYHPLAVPYTACCWHATSKTPTHNNIKEQLLLLLSQNHVQLLGWVAQSQPLQQITQTKEKLVFGATDEEIIEG